MLPDFETFTMFGLSLATNVNFVSASAKIVETDLIIITQLRLI